MSFLRFLTPVALVLSAFLAGNIPATVASSATPEATVTATQTKPTACFYPSHSRKKLEQANAMLGTDFDCVMVFTDAIPTKDGVWDWAGWEKPWLLRTKPGEDINWMAWKAEKPGRRLVVAHSLVPQNPPTDWRERGAAGEYEEHAKAYARNMVAAGLGDSIIRLAHEPNGTWFHHHIGDTVEQRAAWAQFWARTVRAMRSVEGADFRFDLNPNAVVRNVPMEQYYPGDDVVDVIGIDQYDSCTGTCATVKGWDRFTTIKSQAGGMDYIAAFAKAHGKPISIPEFGLVTSTKYGLDDDPFFVRGMQSFVASHDTDYYAYFDKNNGGTFRLAEVPMSFEAYRGWLHEPTATVTP